MIHPLVPRAKDSPVDLRLTLLFRKRKRKIETVSFSFAAMYKWLKIRCIKHYTFPLTLLSDVLYLISIALFLKNYSELKLLNPHFSVTVGDWSIFSGDEANRLLYRLLIMTLMPLLICTILSGVIYLSNKRHGRLTESYYMLYPKLLFTKIYSKILLADVESFCDVSNQELQLRAKSLINNVKNTAETNRELFHTTINIFPSVYTVILPGVILISFSVIPNKVYPISSFLVDSFGFAYAVVLAVTRFSTLRAISNISRMLMREFISDLNMAYDYLVVESGDSGSQITAKHQHSPKHLRTQ